MTKNNIIDIILLLILFVSINYLTYKDKNRNMFSFKYLFILFIIYLIPITFMMFDRDDDIYSSKNLYSNIFLARTKEVDLSIKITKSL